MRTEKRTKFKGLGEILKFVSEIKGGVKLRTDGYLGTKSIFVPKGGGQPTLTIMREYDEPFKKFVFSDGKLWFQGFLEYQDGCFLSMDGKWVLIKDEITEIG